MNDSFVSVVEHREDSNLFVVRGRFAGDVARFLGDEGVVELVTPHADYRYRVVASRADVARAVKRALAAIDYVNFKDSIKEPFRKVPALLTWEAWYQAQHDHVFGGEDDGEFYCGLD